MLCRWGGSDCGRKFRLDFLPVSTRLHPQLQAGDRKQCVYKCVCVSDSGYSLARSFINPKVSFNFACLSLSLSVCLLTHHIKKVPAPASFLFTMSRLDFKIGAGFSDGCPEMCSTPGLHYLLTPYPPLGPLIPQQVFVCVCRCLCVCNSASQLSQPEIAVLPSPTNSPSLPPSFLSPFLPLPLSVSLSLPLSTTSEQHESGRTGELWREGVKNQKQREGFTLGGKEKGRGKEM